MNPTHAGAHWVAKNRNCPSDAVISRRLGAQHSQSAERAPFKLLRRLADIYTDCASCSRRFRLLERPGCLSIYIEENGLALPSIYRAE